MSAQGELGRLNRLGAEAAEHQVRINNAVNHPVSESETERQLRRGLNRHHVPLAGRLAISAFLWVIFTFGFAVAGLWRPGVLGLVALVIAEGSFFLWKFRRAGRLKEQAVSLQSELHDLKQREFELRYEQARQDGSLKFGEKGDRT